MANQFKTYKYLNVKDGEVRDAKDCLLLNHTYYAGQNVIYRDETVENQSKFVFLNDAKEAERYYNYVKKEYRYPRLSCYVMQGAPRKICLDLDMEVNDPDHEEPLDMNTATSIYNDTIDALKLFMKTYHSDKIFTDDDIWTYTRHRPDKFSFRVISPYVLLDKNEQDHMIDALRDMMCLVDDDRKMIDKYGVFMQSPMNYKVVDGHAYRMDWNVDLNTKPDEPTFAECQMALFTLQDGKFGEDLVLKRIAPRRTKSEQQMKIEVEMKEVLDVVMQIEDFKDWATVGVINDLGFIPLIRNKPSHCPIHDRLHTNMDGYLKVMPDGNIFQGCHVTDAPAPNCKKYIKIGEVKAVNNDEPKLTYPEYKRFQHLVDGKKQDWHPRDINKWVKDALVYIDNGGNEFILTLNSRTTYTDNDEKINTTYYETLKPHKLLKNLDLSVNILNPLFDATKPISNDNKIYWFNNLAEYVKYSMANRTNLMYTYNSVTFRPYAGRDAPNLGDSLNLFTGYSILNHKPTRRVEFIGTKTFAHWRDAFCSADDKVFDYFIKYFAHRVQFPHKRPDVAMIIQSDQGLGKDLMRLFMTKIFGESYILTYQNIGLFFKNFNVEQSGKILTFLNELADKGAHFAKHDQFKGEITKDVIRVEPKGMEVYNVNHCSGYVGFTQQENCLYVENSDRRLFMIKADNTHANDHAYFAHIIDEMNDLDVIHGAYEYFMNIDLSKFIVRNFPMTDFKKEQLIRNLPAPIKFLMDVGRAANGGDDHKFVNNANVYLKSNEIKVRAPDMWSMFEEWCDEEKANSRYTKTSFYEQLDKLGLTRTAFRMGSGLIKGYSTSVLQLEELIGKHIKHPDFKIVV